MTVPTPEEKEDCQADAYQEWLPKQGQLYIMNQLIGGIATVPLDEEELKVICNMVRDRDFTGERDACFYDIRSAV
jgi:hypothetical protein